MSGSFFSRYSKCILLSVKLNKFLMSVKSNNVKLNIFSFSVKYKVISGPRQANLCLRAFRHDKF